MCALVALREIHKTTVSCVSRTRVAGICREICHETHAIPVSCVSLFGLGVSTAKETLICICRPFWLEQAMRSFSLPTRLKCGQRPLEILGVFTVFGWLAASRRPKAGETPRRQAVRRGSMGQPVRPTPNHTRTALLPFAGYPAERLSIAYLPDIQPEGSQMYICWISGNKNGQNGQKPGRISKQSALKPILNPFFVDIRQLWNAEGSFLPSNLRGAP